MNEELEKIIEEEANLLGFKKETPEYTILERLALKATKLGFEECHKGFTNMFPFIK